MRPFVVYSEKMKTSKVFLRDCSVASPLPILLFGRQVDVDHRSSVVVVDGWIKLKVTGRCSAILMAVRERLDALLRSKVQGGRGRRSCGIKVENIKRRRPWRRWRRLPRHHHELVERRGGHAFVEIMNFITGPPLCRRGQSIVIAHRHA